MAAGEEGSWHYCELALSTKDLLLISPLLQSLLEKNNIRDFTFDASTSNLPRKVLSLLPEDARRTTNTGSRLQLTHTHSSANTKTASIFTADLAQLLQSSFAHHYVPYYPSPLINITSMSFGMQYDYVKDYPSAESLAVFLGLFQTSMQDFSHEMISKIQLHQAKWFSYFVQYSSRNAEDKLQVVVRYWTFRPLPVFSSNTALGSDTPSDSTHNHYPKGTMLFVSPDIKEEQVSQLGFIETRHLPPLPLPSSSPSVDRVLHNSRSLRFQLVTEIVIDPSITSIKLYEIIPYQAEMFLHSLRYSLLNVEGGSRQGFVTDLDSFVYTDEHCNIFSPSYKHYVQPSSSEINCLSTVSYEIPLSSNMSWTKVQISFEATKRFMKIGYIPPDGSYGFHWPSATVTFNIHYSTPEVHHTSTFLLTQPIPDSSMPYNVVTLISTVLAFLVGSLINAWARKGMKTDQPKK